MVAGENRDARRFVPHPAGTAPQARRYQAMSQRTHPAAHPAPQTEGLERMDVEAATLAARHRHHPLVKTLGAASELADQIPLGTVCGAVIAGGLAAGRPDVARTGLRMMVAHVLANAVKRQIKNRLRRIRPEEVVKDRDYTFEPGETQGGHDTSFPSGHTAGAVAVAAIVARDMPPLALPAWAAAALMSGVQIPRAKHYPADVAAGAALGLTAARLVDLLLPPNPPSQENPMSDSATKTIVALFQTREAADYAIEHLVQQHGLNRADIFAEAQGDDNTAGTRPSGGDAAKGDTPSDPALRGGIRLSADVAADKADLVRNAFEEMGGQDIAAR